MLKTDKTTRDLILYYGLLQTLHLLVLLRAGILLRFSSTIPFPILPPSSGWQDQTWPFLFGLAGMDVVGIILAIVFAVRSQSKGVIAHKLGLISLTIFFSGGIVFAVGTLPTGAWFQYPIAYVSMVLLFIPCIFLYFRLIAATRES